MMRVYSLAQLANLAKHKRAVLVHQVSWGGKARPAVVVLNMSGAAILRLITDGLYVYEKGKANDAD